MKDRKTSAGGKVRSDPKKQGRAKEKKASRKQAPPVRKARQARTTDEAVKPGKKAGYKKIAGVQKTRSDNSAKHSPVTKSEDPAGAAKRVRNKSQAASSGAAGGDLSMLLEALVQDLESESPDNEEIYKTWDTIRERYAFGENLSVIRRKIGAMGDVLKSLDAWDACPGRLDDRGAAVDPVTGFRTKTYAAWRMAGGEAESHLGSILESVLNVLVDVIKQGNGEQAARALRLLIDRLLFVLNEIKRLSKNDWKRELFKKDAQGRLEYPSLLSRFTKENLGAEKFVSEELHLGVRLPFNIDPRKPYTPQCILAMKIVMWIDTERSWRDSPYLKVAPNLGDFCTANTNAWENVIAFHLDYFQSPGEKRWREYVSEFQLEDNQEPDEGDDLLPEERFRRGALLHVNRNCGPVGDITESPELKSILDGCSKRRTESEAKRYNILKYKVIDAVRGLMPDA